MVSRFVAFSHFAVVDKISRQLLRLFVVPSGNLIASVSPVVGVTLHSGNVIQPSSTWLAPTNGSGCLPSAGFWPNMGLFVSWAVCAEPEGCGPLCAVTVMPIEQTTRAGSDVMGAALRAVGFRRYCSCNRSKRRNSSRPLRLETAQIRQFVLDDCRQVAGECLAQSVDSSGSGNVGSHSAELPCDERPVSLVAWSEAAVLGLGYG